MKKLLRLTLALALLAPAPASFTADAKKPRRAASSRAATSRYDKFSGTVGKYKVTMFLDANYNGYYYYGNGSKGKLTVKGRQAGEVCGPACVGLILTEYDSKGNRTGTWNVYLSSMAVSPGQRIIVLNGDMTTSAGRTFEVDMWLDN